MVIPHPTAPKRESKPTRARPVDEKRSVSEGGRFWRRSLSDGGRRLPPLAIFVLLTSCSTLLPPPPQPLTEQAIVALSGQKIPATEIIQKIDDSRTAYHLKTADVLRLKEAGVSDEVIDRMLETYTQKKVSEERGRNFFSTNSIYREPVAGDRYYP